MTITVATLCLLLLGLGCCTLFLPRMRFSLWCQQYLNAPASLFFYSLGMIGLVLLFVLIKKKQTLLARFGVSENQVINLNSEQLKRLNTLLFIIAFLGPILFPFTFYFAFQGPDLLAFFCYLISLISLFCPIGYYCIYILSRILTLGTVFRRDVVTEVQQNGITFGALAGQMVERTLKV